MEFSVKDKLRQLVESESGGKNTIIYDDFGNPMIMLWVPKFKMEDMVPNSTTTGTHGAFVIDDGKEIDGFWVSKFPNVCAGGVAMNRDLHNSFTGLTFEKARSACAKKGKGWHLVTALEWAAITWISKRYQCGGRYGNLYVEPRIAAMSHDRTPYGFMIDKHWEHVDGMRLGPGFEKLYTWLGSDGVPQNRFWENKYSDAKIWFDYYNLNGTPIMHLTGLEQGASNRNNLPSTNFNGEPPVPFDNVRILNENGKEGSYCGNYKVTQHERDVVRHLCLAPHPGRSGYKGWCGFRRVNGSESFTFARGGSWEQVRAEVSSLFSYWNIDNTREIAFRAAYIPID